jgi:lipoate-protein ligase A
MKLLRLTLPSPQENLALDEALLDLADAGGDETLRLWESPTPFVVVGYGNTIATEVDEAACAANGIPVLRRCSGGGTVVQGPGCLSYAVALRLDRDPMLATVSGANHFVMDRLRSALQALCPFPLSIQGHTDLCRAAEKPEGGWIKFSGNAQRRRHNALLFHGTLLLDFDLALLAKLLLAPSLQPDYRGGRDHEAFVCNLSLSRVDVDSALVRQWNASEPLEAVPDVTRLMREKYARPEWHAHRG